LKPTALKGKKSDLAREWQPSTFDGVSLAEARAIGSLSILWPIQFVPPPLCLCQ